MAKLPVISVEQMRQWEAASWAAGRLQSAVIEQVGRAAAARLCQLTQPSETIWILAGKGHNGDDARAMVPGLAGRTVVLTNVTDPAAALASFPGNAAWIVDGLFGIGLNRPLSEVWRPLFDAIDRSAIPVFALDVPSGFDADTGSAEGPAIKAALTFTVGAPKRGMLRTAEYLGRVEVADDIGLLPCPFASELNWTLAQDFRGWPPRRPSATNKGSFGHAAIIAGSMGYHGAAVLAARGALRARPGLVTVFPQEQVYVPVAAQLHSAMVQPWLPGKALPEKCSAVLFGPGLAGQHPEALRTHVAETWRRSDLAVVLDASALDWMPEGPTPEGAPRVVTPHPGEAGRLLKCSAEQVQKDRPVALREISRRFGNCWVALKGHQTLVGRATGDIFVNSSGNPYLGQGGTGDLLAGYLTGLLAQPQWRRNPLMATRFAVWQHGAAADYLSAGSRNWTLDELEKELGQIKI